MLILVAVSISIALNTGLFDSAGKATQKWDTDQDVEQELGSGKVNIAGTTYENIDEYLNELNPPVIVAGQKATANSIYNDSNGKTAIIPAGFTVSGVKTSTTDETTIDDGLVIYLIPEGETVDWTDGTEVAEAQQTYDQFVWIPINDINEMYMCQSEDGTKSCRITVQEVEGKQVAYCKTHSSQLMAGRLYITDKGKFDETLTSQTYREGFELREPDVVIGTDTLFDAGSQYLNDILNKILGTNYNTASDFKEDLQKEYNEIVKSVYQNKGFYVGRYETSNVATTDATAIDVVAGKIPSKNINWYYMYAQQKEYAKNNDLTVGSTMIQGAAYDQVMKFVDPTNTWIKTSGTERVSHDLSDAYQTSGLNYSGTIEYNDMAKNIFDLEGNVRVWNTVANANERRISMGGAFDSGTAAANFQGDGRWPGEGQDEVGSLCQLYVK